VAKKSNEENKAMIVALLEEKRAAEIYGTDNLEEINAALTRLGYTAEKPSKRAERRPGQGVNTETR